MGRWIWETAKLALLGFFIGTAFLIAIGYGAS